MTSSLTSGLSAGQNLSSFVASDDYIDAHYVVSVNRFDARLLQKKIHWEMKKANKHFKQTL